MVSPELLVDDLYQSMDGPQATISLDLNTEGTELEKYLKAKGLLN